MGYELGFRLAATRSVRDGPLPYLIMVRMIGWLALLAQSDAVNTAGVAGATA
jgi:hypothetical protein